MDRPTVYWKPRCPFCVMLRAKLWLARCRVDAVDISTDPEAAALVRSVNDSDEVTPTVRVRDRYLSNPSLREVRAALLNSTRG